MAPDDHPNTLGDVSRPERVLVIGAAGLVGRHLVRALGTRAVATFHRDPIEGALQLDVRDPSSVGDVVGRVRPAAVLLAAAQSHVEECERDPGAARRVNVQGAENVRRVTPKIPVVVFSSEYVFDGRAGLYAEDAPVAPINEYGRQKVELEAIARRGPHLVVRTSGVFGSEPRRKNFVQQLVDALRAGRPFTVASDQVITPTYAPALASAVIELLDTGAIGTFHVCGPRVVPRTEFAQMVAHAFGLPHDLIRARPTSELGLLAPRPQAAGLSDARLRRTTGRALMDPDASLAEMAREGA